MTGIRYVALARRVLVVAVTYEDETWAAYVDAVQGADHDEECHDVARCGVKLPAEHARRFFPLLAVAPYKE